MSNAVTYVLGSRTVRDRKKADRFASLHPTRLDDIEDIVEAVKHAGKSDIWIALSRHAAAAAIQGALRARKSLGVLVVLDGLEFATATALSTCFHSVLFAAPHRAVLP